MRKLILSLTASVGLSLFAGLGVTALGLVVSPGEADAYCRTYYRRTRYCSYRYGRRFCSYVNRRYTTCSPRCSYRRYRQRYCYRTAGRTIRSRYCYTSYRRGYRYRRCSYRTRYVPGYRRCSYRWTTRKVCY